MYVTESDNYLCIWLILTITYVCDWVWQLPMYVTESDNYLCEIDLSMKVPVFEHKVWMCLNKTIKQKCVWNLLSRAYVSEFDYNISLNLISK